MNFLLKGLRMVKLKYDNFYYIPIFGKNDTMLLIGDFWSE